MERAQLRKIALATGSAIEKNGFVFLRDPKLAATELARIETILAALPGENEAVRGWLCIATGGTGGGLRFARHDEGTLGAAARGFAGHFGCNRINAVDVLPAHHVSGFMSRIRCAETGGMHLPWSWKRLEAGEWPPLKEREDGWFLSLVPTQLQRLLNHPESVDQLRSFRAVFIGGGPLWPELAAEARAARLPVAICYGMTETAAMAVAQKPGEFLQGDDSCGRAMPHAQIRIVDENDGGDQPAGVTGLVWVEGPSTCRGFFPERPVQEGRVETEDLGFCDESGRLRILGRRDAVIITGGKKVQPLEVETALRASGEFADLAVVGVPDREWGSAVVVCYLPRKDKIDTVAVHKAAETLAAYKRPKQYLAVAPWPRNAQGKLNRAALIELALAALGRD